MPFHYYHHERMRVCLVHTTCLTLVPCVPRTCPDVEPVHGTTTMPVNMPRRRRWPACGSTVPLSSAAMLLRPTTGLGYRIDNEHHFSMEPRNHTLEPAFLSPCLRSTCSGTKWNQDRIQATLLGFLGRHFSTTKWNQADPSGSESGSEPLCLDF